MKVILLLLLVLVGALLLRRRRRPGITIAYGSMAAREQMRREHDDRPK